MNTLKPAWGLIVFAKQPAAQREATAINSRRIILLPFPGALFSLRRHVTQYSDKLQELETHGPNTQCQPPP